MRPPSRLHGRRPRRPTVAPRVDLSAAGARRSLANQYIAAIDGGSSRDIDEARFEAFTEIVSC
jgi:hypothetical protein